MCGGVEWITGVSLIPSRGVESRQESVVVKHLGNSFVKSQPMVSHETTMSRRRGSWFPPRQLFKSVFFFFFFSPTSFKGPGADLSLPAVRGTAVERRGRGPREAAERNAGGGDGRVQLHGMA